MKRKLFWLLILLTAAVGLSAGGIEDMQGLELKHIKIPFYKENKPQLLVFADSGNRQDKLMIVGNTLLDMLLDNANVDKIPDGWRVRPRDAKGTLPEGFTELYPLNAPFKDILEFWRPRVRISDAVIFTSASTIDQSNEIIRGDHPIFFRSPLFDLNGVGFSVNFQDQTIDIDSNVRIVLRSSDMDPRKIFNGAAHPAEQRIITASSQQMRINQKSSKIILIGDVKVIDGRNRLSCNRLTLFLSNDKNSRKSRKSHQDEKAVLEGVSRVLADGNVHLLQTPENPFNVIKKTDTAADCGRTAGLFAMFAVDFQESKADHMEYDVKREILILTSDRSHPTLKRGTASKLSGKRIELLRHEDKMFVLQDCQITSAAFNAKENKFYERKINSDRANFDGKNNIANFHGNVVALDLNTMLHTDSLRINLSQQQDSSEPKVERLFGNGNVRIIHRSEEKSPAHPGRKLIMQSTISSTRAELNYRSNKLVFYGDVKVRDDSAALDCERLDLFLADKKASVKKSDISGAPLAAGAEGQNKTLTRMIAKGEVRMTSKDDSLETDMLTLHFRDLPRGAKPSPGMIQSGGVQLTKIYCDGNVHAVSRTKEGNRVLNAANAVSDLVKDYSEFHGNVSLKDGNTEIYSRDMYIFTGASPIDTVITENKVIQPQKSADRHRDELDDDLDDDDLDADPFAMDMGENSVPTKIAISDSRELKRVVCQKQVVLLRRDKQGNLQRAGGDRAVYTVNTREVVLTAEPPNRPWIRSSGRKQFCDIITSDMATEDLRGIGNVVVMPDED